MVYEGLTSQGKDDGISQLRTVCLAFLLKQVNSLTHQEYDLDDLHLLDNSHVNSHVVMETEKVFSIPPFSIPKGNNYKNRYFHMSNRYTNISYEEFLVICLRKQLMTGWLVLMLGKTITNLSNFANSGNWPKFPCC